MPWRITPEGSLWVESIVRTMMVMKTWGMLLTVLMCACTAEDPAIEGYTPTISLLLGEWSVTFNPGECASDGDSETADFRITPYEDGGAPLVVLVVEGEDVGNAGFLLDSTSGRVRYETAYDGDVFDLELADDGNEASAFVRYTHAHDCTVETEATSIERVRLGER